MSIPNLSITITTGNLNRQEPDADNVAALIMPEYLTASGFPAHTPKVVYSLKQAEDLGITPALDTSLNRLGHQHIKDFFRKNPNGELHIMCTDAAEWIDILGSDSAVHSAAKLIIPQNGRIKQLAIMSEKTTATAFNDVLLGENIVEAAQAFADRMFALRMPLDVVFLEGFGFNADAGSSADLRAKDCRNISVVVGGDKNVASAAAAFNNYAAVGLVLGCSTGKQIHESFAEAKDSNVLTDVATSSFLDAKITSSAAADEYLGDNAAINALHNKGYVFPRQFPLRSGFYWNQSNNTVAASDDFNNTESVQVIHKTLRLLYVVLAPLVNKNFKVTAAGRLTDIERQTVVVSIKKILENNLANNVSDIGSIIVDPAKKADNTNYPSILVDKTLRAIVGIRPFGKAEFITLEVGFQA